MNPALWRAAALTCIAIAVAFVLYQPILPDRDTFGMTYRVPRSDPGKVVVTSVEPNSQAARAGIRRGDLLAYGNSAVDRARAVYVMPGAQVSVLVNGTRRVTLNARNRAPIDIPWPATGIRLAFLLIAAVLAWRRPQDRATRSLVVFLICYGFAISLANGVLPNPILSLIVLQLLPGSLFIAGTAALAWFAAHFPTGTAQKLPQRLSIVTLCVAAFIIILISAVQWVPRNATIVSLLNATFQFAFLILSALVLTILIAAYVQGAPSERQRRRWIFLMLGVAICGPIADVIVQAIAGLNPWLDALTLLPLGALPFGLAYVILRHRVIDVGFVLNRALVYTILSTLIVGVFVVAESLLSKYVEHQSRVASLAFQFALTIALALSVRFIHAKVDRFVDTLLFRERHAAEAAIRDFAHDASYITDARVLLTRTVQVLERYAGSRGAGVWTTAGNGLYTPAESTFPTSTPVDENDAALVAMRARRVVVDLRDSGSALPGALGFPMILRGDLVGVLVCGQKRDDDTYAPDERDALAALTSSVAHALDAIEIRDLRRRLAHAGASGVVNS